MHSNTKRRTLLGQWPAAIVALGIALSLIWIGVLVFIPLRLLDIL